MSDGGEFQVESPGNRLVAGLGGFPSQKFKQNVDIYPRKINSIMKPQGEHLTLNRHAQRIYYTPPRITGRSKKIWVSDNVIFIKVKKKPSRISRATITLGISLTIITISIIMARLMR